MQEGRGKPQNGGQAAWRLAFGAAKGSPADLAIRRHFKATTLPEKLGSPQE